MQEFTEYNWQGITYPPDYLKTLFDFARERQFKRGLEIGFDQGGSALALLRGSPNALLLSIDIGSCDGGLGLVASSEVNDRHTFRQADSRIELPNILAVHEDGGNETGELFDFIYIDGDHLHGAVAQDIQNAVRLLDEGGIIVLDDAQPGHSHFGVYSALEEFCMNNPEWRHMPLIGSPSFMEVLEHV